MLSATQNILLNNAEHMTDALYDKNIPPSLSI